MPPSSQKATNTAQSTPKPRPPSWYCRLVVLGIKKNRDIRPHDFDEDLSDLEESGETAENDAFAEEECGCEGSDCECESLDGDTGDNQSEKSYNGSDADYYYELKFEREERKRELRDCRERERKAKEERRVSEIQKVKEVQEAYENLQELLRRGDTPPKLDSLSRKHFKLYSLDHFDYRYNEIHYGSKYIEFHSLEDSTAPGDKPRPKDKAARGNGHIYFDGNCGYDFLRFRHRKKAGLKEYRLKGDDKFDVKICFIGNDYITVTVPRELVFEDVSPNSSAPEMFKFMGIRFDFEKERQRVLAKRKRSPSPQESWFESTHPYL
ncbi:hypothetical protein FDECE_16026 [Fusarium decemcellulare]|nr:hypothetical protein FDECE_16026 [Fusarium decemcellulare]